MNKRKVFNISVTALLSLLFILTGAFYFKTSYLRFAETVRDLINSVIYFFKELFGIQHTTQATVEGYSSVLEWNAFLPPDWQTFTERTREYFRLLFNKENFLAYSKEFGGVCLTISKGAAIFVPCWFVFWFVIKKLYRASNNDHNRDTIPLRIFKWFAKITYQPIKRAIQSYIAFLSENNIILILWIVLWAFHLNFASIVTAFFAYYIYFVVSFRFETMYVQLAKLVIDLQTGIRHFPWWVLLFVGYWLFYRFRVRIAKSRLRHYEARNCGFINELPIVTMACGSMGKKKTTLITDMALSQEVMFRQKAFELIKKNDMKFPYFPWIKLEMQMLKCMEYGTIYNLATIKELIALKRARYERHQDSELQLYGYDVARYGIVYDDGLKKEYLFDVLESYAQLYFIYVLECSLMVSNYSVRTDSQLLSEGNFPMWAIDFFPEQTIERGRHANILDFDVLRLGKKVIENNPNAGSFEFGVVMISEVGKERGNMLDHREMKRNNDETNQKNDLFNSWLKMCRHSATVDFYPFVKVFLDEQRPESLGADARELCDIINVVSTGKNKLALPFYIFEEMIYDFLFDWFIDFYYDFRYRRGDNTLLVYLLKGVVSWLYKRHVKVYNQYGYQVVQLEKERGTMTGAIEKKKYFLMSKKIYARRFSTDCFSDYFNDQASKTGVGLEDYLEYESEKATVSELRMQNSYFINALYKNAGSDE